ncbi:uncharacterized protein ACJ7VT_013818 [Polymixia lowei]
MNRGDKSAKKALRCQQQPKAQQQGVQKKKRDPSTLYKDSPGGSYSQASVTQDTRAVQCDTVKEVKLVGEGKRPTNVVPSATTEYQKTQNAQRKLSDASNASEDLSKDSGCVSGKLSSSDSSSELSDYTSEGHKLDSQNSDTELSWIDGRAYVSPDTSAGGKCDDKSHTGETQDNGTLRSDVGDSFPGLGVSLGASGGFLDLMMGETTEDLVREVEDLRSENEYLKDEMEELRCEMLEMRDMFQEEEVYQLQELRLKLDQANKTCRILQYRLRKAERRSIRVAQTGQVDGELVRTLEHDIKVAKSVSLRLHNELESVQKKNSQLEWENEALRERTQELEVAKQVLQAEMDKAVSRESSQRRKGVRSPPSKAEKRLSQLIEDDSADLKCQLHFTKEELALMCKKLTKLVSESEGMREKLAKYHSAYGDIDATQSPEGNRNCAYAREAEVKVHLKLVEEEATLLSRRIVELEVENRGLREEMSSLREKLGGCEEEEPLEVVAEDLSHFTQARDREGREQSLKMGYAEYKQGEEENAAKDIAVVDSSLPRDIDQAQTEGMLAGCQITREGPVGGEWDPTDSQEKDTDKKGDRGLHGMTMKDYEALLALKDQSCIVSSAIQLLTIPPQTNGYCSSPSDGFFSKTEMDGKAQLLEKDPFLQGPLNEALALLQTMLLAFIVRVEKLLTGDELGGVSLPKDGHFWDSYIFSFLSGGCAARGLDTLNIIESPGKQEIIEDLCAAEVKERAKQAQQGPPSHLGLSCREPKMRLTLQILWVLHQWCQVKGPELEENKARDKTLFALRRLLQELGAELWDGGTEFDSEDQATRCKATEDAVSAIFNEGRYSEIDRTDNTKEKKYRPSFSPYGSNSKTWCYLSQEAAQLDQEDPVKTWDHPIMPLSFPDLDLEQISMERSHTAPERTAFRIYYSPPSARRVQLAQLKQSPVTDRDSVATVSPWCTPRTSFSPLCLGLSANLSDDMKEMTASWRQPARSSSLERRRGRFVGGWVDVACSGTQTQTQPQMVSVGLQTDGPQGVFAVRNSLSRGLNSSLASARAHHISTSLERVTGRVERPKPTATSPKLYRRHSASSPLSSSTAFSNTLSSSSSAAASRERALWNLSQQGHGMTWARPTTRAGGGHNHNTLNAPNSEVGSSSRNTKPPSKSAGTNRCGLVTEFLRRVSGRVEKPVPGAGQKGKTGLKNLERIPTRPPAVPLHRNDSVTRIVNQRFMKQREEASRVQREEKGSRQNQAARGTISRDESLSTVTTEDGNYGCSSSSTLTFCFARPSRSTQQRQASNPSKLQRHRYSPAVGGSADSNCE